MVAPLPGQRPGEERGDAGADRLHRVPDRAAVHRRDGEPDRAADRAGAAGAARGGRRCCCASAPGPRDARRRFSRRRRARPGRRGRSRRSAARPGSPSSPPGRGRSPGSDRAASPGRACRPRFRPASERRGAAGVVAGAPAGPARPVSHGGVQAARAARSRAAAGALRSGMIISVSAGAEPCMAARTAARSTRRRRRISPAPEVRDGLPGAALQMAEPPLGSAPEFSRGRRGRLRDHERIPDVRDTCLRTGRPGGARAA